MIDVLTDSEHPFLRLLVFEYYILLLYREGINLALVKLKKDGVITKLWRKWLLNRKPDCDHVKDEVMR